MSRNHPRGGRGQYPTRTSAPTFDNLLAPDSSLPTRQSSPASRSSSGYRSSPSDEPVIPLLTTRALEPPHYPRPLTPEPSHSFPMPPSAFHGSGQLQPRDSRPNPYYSEPGAEYGWRGDLRQQARREEEERSAQRAAQRAADRAADRAARQAPVPSQRPQHRELRPASPSHPRGNQSMEDRAAELGIGYAPGDSDRRRTVRENARRTKAARKAKAEQDKRWDFEL